MRFAPHLLSFLVGALSLGQEVLWVRLYGFARAGTPTAFSFVLVAYLLGIAVGAAIGRRITLRRHNPSPAARVFCATLTGSPGTD